MSGADGATAPETLRQEGPFRQDNLERGARDFAAGPPKGMTHVGPMR